MSARIDPRALEINREQGPDHMGKVLGGASMGVPGMPSTHFCAVPTCITAPLP